jgi:predicted dehydrogenase
MNPASFPLSRRQFLHSAAVLAAGAGLPAWFLEESQSHAATAAPQAANDKPNIGWIGCGGRGNGIIRQARRFGTVVALCDADAGRLERAAAQFSGAKTYRDFRQVIERNDIDVIVNATPDHWHTLINVAALKAGKDVYSEKPLTLTIDEGRRLVAVEKKTKRILQTGSQQRSDARFRLACELVRNGRLGKLEHVLTALPGGPRRGPFSTAPVPPELDWDYWLGPTPKVEYVPERCHGSFRYWLEYSGGTMTDWGAHHNDIALWALGLERSGPVTIEGKVLEQPIPGGFTTPSQYRVDYTYANGVKHTCLSLARRERGTPATPRKPGDIANGVKFEGTQGWIFVDRGRIEASKPELLSEPLPGSAERLYASTDHMGNFFECVRSRKPPICEAEIGHRSVSVCHLGVIALRLGRKLRWDPEREVFADDKEANTYLSREMRKPWTLEAV